MTDLMKKRCTHWDCGWCYAPTDTQTNSNNGSCWAPASCPQQQKLLQEEVSSMINHKDNPAEIYLVPMLDDDHDHIWSQDPAPAEGMREEDATRYVREDLVPASNEVLAKRIVELTNELATANSMHLDNDRYKYEQRGFGCVDDLLLHFDALAAQVEQLKSAYKELAGAINDADDCEDGTLEMEEATGKIFAVMQHGYNTAFRATPTQCLVEVKAQTVEALKFPTMFRKMWSGGEVQEWLKEEARLLRQQAKPSGTWLKDSNTHCNAKAGA